MTEAQFWNLIEQSRQNCPACEQQSQQLQQILTALPPTEIVEFQQIFADKLALAYRWDLWGVAYLIGGGCSDDGFEYFCRWLVGQGKARYEQALVDPESVIEGLSEHERDLECEELFYASGAAYEALTGEMMPMVDLAYPRHPIGEPWIETELVDRFPRVAQRGAM